jgi:hypothetical protein
MLESFNHHNSDLEINVYCFRKEFCEFGTLDSRIKLRSLDNSIVNRAFRRDEKGVRRGYKARSHLGTARAWANIIASNKANFYLHLDADQIFLANVIDEIVSRLGEGFDLVGTRRPYFNRRYRKTGRDAVALDKMPDAVNTDLLGFSRNVIGNLWSPLAVRRIRGRRTSSRRVIDFFDPVFFKALDRGAKVFYLDSADSTPRGESNFDSVYYRS